MIEIYPIRPPAFSDTRFDQYSKKTRKEAFQEDMGRIISLEGTGGGVHLKNWRDVPSPALIRIYPAQATDSRPFDLLDWLEIHDL